LVGARYGSLYVLNAVIRDRVKRSRSGHPWPLKINAIVLIAKIKKQPSMAALFKKSKLNTGAGNGAGFLFFVKLAG
jgi:hypothetical protein